MLESTSKQDKLVNFRWELGMYEELKMLALNEHTTVKALITRELSDYVKKHKDGNPQYTLEQFKDPDFIACPAFYRDSLAWGSYCAKASPAELLKLKNQILLIEKQTLRYL